MGGGLKRLYQMDMSKRQADLESNVLYAAGQMLAVITTAPTAVQRWMVMGMSRYIEQGKPIFIPFEHGISITDSQLHLRMYKTVEMFKRHFPKNTKYDVLCEYAPIVRCKDCDWYDLECESCNFWGGVRHPEHFCGEGERKDNEQKN